MNRPYGMEKNLIPAVGADIIRLHGGKRIATPSRAMVRNDGGGVWQERFFAGQPVPYGLRGLQIYALWAGREKALDKCVYTM